MSTDMGGWCLGIDISKPILDCARSDHNETWHVANTVDGWSELTDRFADDPPVRVVMEATGALHIGLHLHLTACGWHASVINPSWIASYARSQGQLAKTDRVDARLLAREMPDATPVSSPAQHHIVALLRRRAQLVKLRVMQTNQAGSALFDDVRASCEAVVAMLHCQIQGLNTRITDILQSDPELAAKSDQMQSMPGIGPVTSTCLIGVFAGTWHAGVEKVGVPGRVGAASEA